MEDAALPEQRRGQVGGGEHQVCPRIPVEGEGTVAALVQADEGQRGVHLRIFGDVAGVNAVALHRVDEEAAEGVVAHPADERPLCPQRRRRGQHIGRGSAGILGIEYLFRPRRALRGKVNEQFAQRENVKRHKKGLPSNSYYFLLL